MTGIVKFGIASTIVLLVFGALVLYFESVNLTTLQYIVWILIGGAVILGSIRYLWNK